ncbi:MAG: hypothetical protein EHM12_10855 [Dehalococcoidia bacterium]|nr:MAG: hypothetical protein EHM12_10855 [Dehalococcoidia bacterium]
MKQFIPNVTESDVERIVRRDFPNEQVEKILATIQQVDVREKPRVILACLKIANGNIERLRNELSNASGYYREIISEAEYPYYSKKYFKIDKLSEDERNKIIEKDRDQYLKWISRI